METQEYRVKARFERAGKYKHLFPESKCLVPISVGQPYHEGEKFKATIDLINANFQECTIMVCDTLQRHTLKFKHDLTDDEAYELSLKRGDEWLKRNVRYLKQLEIPYHVWRWDIWLQDPNYDEVKREFFARYDIDLDFQKLFVDQANNFIDRYKKAMSTISTSESCLFNGCFNYLTEESIIKILWVPCEFQFEIYPGRESNVFKKVREIFLKTECCLCMKRLRVKFDMLNVMIENLFY